jgi:hypothetical protein
MTVDDTKMNEGRRGRNERVWGEEGINRSV